MRPRDPGTVGDAVRKYLKHAGLNQRIEQASVVNDWPSLVGPHFAKVTRPESIDRQGTLWVRVRSAAWIQELQLLSPTIIRQLADQGKNIKTIRWKAGQPQRRSSGQGAGAGAARHEGGSDTEEET